MNYDDWGEHSCMNCGAIFEGERDLVLHEITGHDQIRRRLRNKKDPGPTDTEVDEAIASIATAIPKEQP